MKIHFKDLSIKTRLFTAIGLVFLMALIIGAVLQYNASKNEVIDRVLNEARAMRGILMATRRVYHHQFLNSGIPLNEKTLGFLPAYSMKRISDDFKNWLDTGLSFNNVSERPRNPENRADEIEMESIQFFRKHRDKKERLISYENSQGEKYFHYSQPIWMEKYCLLCHGKREDAPPTIQKLYSSSYDYQLGELRGVLSIKLPVDIVNKAAMQRHLLQFSFFIGLFVFIYLIVQYLLRKLVTERLSRLSYTAQQIALGKEDVVFQEDSMDEIGQVERSINMMVNQIRQREQDLAITLDSIGDAVIATDEKGNITRMNPVAEQLTGWLFEDAQGQSINTIFPVIDVSTREPVENLFEKVITNGNVIYLSHDSTLIAKDGKEYQIADSAAPIRNKDNDILGMILVFNNVTEQYQLREAALKSKKHLQAIMDYSPAVIYVKDIDGYYIFVNQKYENLFNLNRTEIIGKTDHELFQNDIADMLQHNDKAIMEAGHVLESEEIIILDGSQHTYASIKFPLFNGNGDAYAVCGMSTNINERKLFEEQSRRSQKMDALGKLTSGIAHDYNNMLGVIAGYAELLKTALSRQPKLAEYAQEIYHASERGSKLTKKLLDFSRYKESIADCLNLNSLLKKQQHMLEKTLTVRIQLVLKLVDDLWTVWLDDSDMEDVILNMSINAMHAIEGHGRLTIKTSNQIITQMEAKLLGLTAGDYVLLSITDTGCGMNKEIIEKIFEPFYSTKGEMGTGLGLSQVYGLVQHSGGVIKVYSHPGHGSHFSLYFPRYIKAAHKEQLAEKNRLVDSTISDKYTETILVVDDELALLNLTCEMLSQHGFNIFSAESAVNALDILEHEAVDLLITDIIMPEMDGYQLACIVKDKYPNIKIQLVSGFADERNKDLVDRSLQQNMLLKPFNSKDLLKRIQTLLDAGGKYK